MQMNQSDFKNLVTLIESTLGIGDKIFIFYKK